MVGGARVITCESTGNVSIGGSTTTYKLDVGGTINCANLYRSGTIVDIPLVSGITTIGTGQASKALTLDASRNAINIASLACDTIIANSTTNILNINPTTLQIKGVALTATATQLNVLNGFTGTTANLNVLSGTTTTSADLTKLAGITATAAELNYLDLTTGAGTAENSKALVLNSTGGISGITTLSTTGSITVGGDINGFLAYGNQSAITSVGSLTELGINATPADEYFSITGSGADYLDASYTRMLTFRGSNATPVQFQIEVNNGTNATSTNATWIGNYSANDIRFGTNQTTRMTLTNTGRLGISTATPSAPLHVNASVSYTWNSASNVGLSVYRLRTDSGATESATGTAITYTNVACIFNGYIGCEAMVMQSDRRLKQDIVDVPLSRVECLYKSLKVKSYRWKKHPDKPKELGLLAQDVLGEGFVDLIGRIPDNDIELEQSSDPWR
ncbi:hypothetical protein PR003_g3143 [Phytophthora rubi]|uniref:Peptidase S74 domain-containing protein n=1 Tax=Phytophthora rubi TaxID=129364 RepID=A0A6A3P347_9STRA|nr:hypothetical protein PR001_g2906 [Phytophthora rubi]KAE9354869.1 hypothetical protein PR003_g3143 [Phytophthora rubi]